MHVNLWKLSQASWQEGGWAGAGVGHPFPPAGSSGMGPREISQILDAKSDLRVGSVTGHILVYI